jgi:glutathione synthase
MLLTAADMGFTIDICEPNAIYARGDQAYANTAALHLKHGLAQIGTSVDWFQQTAFPTAVALADYHAILVRNDPPFNLEYYYLTQILELAAKHGVKVVNHPRVLRNFNEKLAILNFPHLITPTLVSKSKTVIHEFIEEHGVCVAKPIDMMAGRGVFQISRSDANHNAILETLTDYFSQTIMVQRFIPEVVAGDKRIFIINGEVIDHCLYRIPPQGQIRGNLAVGGRGEVHPLSASDWEIAREVASWLKQQNVAIAGIDVIGKCLTEINITSPTGMQQLYHQAGINVAAKILSNLEE